MYNSPEERAMIQAIAHNDQVPSVVVGVGSEIPQHHPAAAVPAEVQRPWTVCGVRGTHRREQGLPGAFRLLLDVFERGTAGGSRSCSSGTRSCPCPPHPRIRHFGFLDDADKFDAIAASELLIMPSYFESLSMVALEAWGLGRPVVANGKCDVLRGQCVRSNAGLYYENRQEFVETLRATGADQWLNVTLGRNGRQFYREHYDWPVIERKYLDIWIVCRSAGGRRARGVARLVRAATSRLSAWRGRRRCRSGRSGAGPGTEFAPAGIGADDRAAGCTSARSSASTTATTVAVPQSAATRAVPAGTVAEQRAPRPGMSIGRTAGGPSGAGHARLRRRHRARSPRHPARPASAPDSSRISSSRRPTAGSSR